MLSIHLQRHICLQGLLRIQLMAREKNVIQEPPSCWARGYLTPALSPQISEPFTVQLLMPPSPRLGSWGQPFQGLRG